jgi:hypothetical protein
MFTNPGSNMVIFLPALLMLRRQYLSDYNTHLLSVNPPLIKLGIGNIVLNLVTQSPATPTLTLVTNNYGTNVTNMYSFPFPKPKFILSVVF